MITILSIVAAITFLLILVVITDMSFIKLLKDEVIVNNQDTFMKLGGAIYLYFKYRKQ